MEAITKKAVEMQDKVDAGMAQPRSSEETPAAAAPSEVAETEPVAPKAMDHEDEAISGGTGVAPDTVTAMAVPDPESRGRKRAGEEADDSERLGRDAEMQQPERQEMKLQRRGDEADDSARMDREATDMSALNAIRNDATVRVAAKHPGALQSQDDPPGDEAWHDVGSGLFARTFRDATRLVTSSKMCTDASSAACRQAR